VKAAWPSSVDSLHAKFKNAALFDPPDLYGTVNDMNETLVLRLYRRTQLEDFTEPSIRADRSDHTAVGDTSNRMDFDKVPEYRIRLHASVHERTDVTDRL
jgi:hypothetical protein